MAPISISSFGFCNSCDTRQLRSFCWWLQHSSICPSLFCSFRFQSIVSGLQGIACWSPLKNDVKTRLLVNAAALAVSAPEKDLRSVIEQVAVRVHGVYVLKTAGDPALDPLRNVVISLYQAREPNAKLRKKKVKQAAQSCLNIDISDNEYYQVMRELCIPKKFSWELKSGE